MRRSRAVAHGVSPPYPLFQAADPRAWPLKIPKSSLHFENGSAGCFFAWFAVYGLAVPMILHWSECIQFAGIVINGGKQVILWAVAFEFYHSGLTVLFALNTIRPCQYFDYMQRNSEE